MYVMQYQVKTIDYSPITVRPIIEQLDFSPIDIKYNFYVALY